VIARRRFEPERSRATIVSTSDRGSNLPPATSCRESGVQRQPRVP
jgi:hypothetical protein